EEGWGSEEVRLLLKLLSMMDSDKDPDAARVGEREGRAASPLVAELAAGFCHGVGRSGDLVAPQPKAPGGSAMYALVNALASDAMRRFGAPNLRHAVVLPLSTGMSIALTLAALRREGRHVVYPRVDHKSPIKGVELVGLRVKVVEGVVEGDAVRVPVEDVVEAVDRETAAIISTTTFFPPREPDDVREIAKAARDLEVPHVVNNAYGVQSREIMRLVRGAADAGRVDAVVQSTDKNFLTPVGGSVVAAKEEEVVERVGGMYAGRATAAPMVQFLAALLCLGVRGYERLRDEQEENRRMLEKLMREVAERHGERLLEVFNPIACAMTLTGRDPAEVGAALYNLRVNGPRALGPEDWGVCCRRYKTAYLTMSAAIGASRLDVERAAERLEQALRQVEKKGGH
ncbi:MAG: O-phosphoseryl-tRNA(Sec) selenium transferase, partial [Candidatus Freyarchaeota archaeon]|nr:O-phosphoseryl-tRNA(Sec) selenium transferase [Candidatus Jordarchaeia archaeon]